MSGANPASSSPGAKPARSKAPDAATSSIDSTTKSPTGKRRTSFVRAAASKNLDTFRQNREYQVAPGAEAESPAKRQKTRTAGKAEETKETTKLPSEIFFGRVPEKPNEKPVWKPSIVMGSPLYLKGEDLSRIELADRKIAQRRALINHYGDITNISELLREAIEEREKLDNDDEENTKPLSSLPSTHQRSVDARVSHLREVLKTSEFLPERQNILAAISGYESGQIPYSEVYTLIWGGYIVDTSPDYSSFTRDRTARLDRYHSQHGDGWLWYEPPLKGEAPTPGPAHMLAQKALCLNSQQTVLGIAEIGHYTIDMGFQKRVENVARYSMPPNWDPTAEEPPYSPDHPRRSSRVYKKQFAPTDLQIPHKAVTMHDKDAPRIYLECLLDSGCTIPNIYTQDLALIGINTKTYAAQTSSIQLTAAGTVLDSRLFELDVGVYKKDPDAANHSTLVSSALPIWPTEVDLLGGTLPVAVHTARDPALASPSSTVEDALRRVSDAPRLSGMLPFMVCYMSSAPGKHNLWLGEDRVDVIGTDRLPGQLRYRNIVDDNRERRREMETGHQDWMSPGGGIGDLRRVVFEHDLADGSNGTLREEDHCEGKSFILVGTQGVDLSPFPAAGPHGPVAVPGGGLGGYAFRYAIDPRDRPEQKVAMNKRTERAERAERERKRQERRRARQDEIREED